MAAFNLSYGFELPLMLTKMNKIYYFVPTEAQKSHTLGSDKRTAMKMKMPPPAIIGSE